MDRSNGMLYAPVGKAKPVCKPGEFVFAAMSLEHGHIYGMCNGLIEAGATLKWVYDVDPEKVAAFRKAYPNVAVADSEADVLEDKEVQLIAAAAIPSERCELGLRAMSTVRIILPIRRLSLHLSRYRRRVSKRLRPGKNIWSITANDSMWKVPSMREA